jgi:hypothetical protein
MSIEVHPELPAKLTSPVLPPEFRANPPVILTERELAFVTSLCTRSVRNFVKRGLIPQIKIGRAVRYRWPQVQIALARLETK